MKTNSYIPATLQRLFGKRSILSFILGAALCAVTAAASEGFNRPGNILIADQFNNRVVEIDQSGKIVWSFGLGPDDFS